MNEYQLVEVTKVLGTHDVLEIHEGKSYVTIVCAEDWILRIWERPNSHSWRKVKVLGSAFWATNEVNGKWNMRDDSHLTGRRSVTEEHVILATGGKPT
tara:strand:- start:268 stop:561 length:294 start_codon:yes stop_codon:yes gene_type:complete